VLILYGVVTSFINLSGEIVQVKVVIQSIHFPLGVEEHLILAMDLMKLFLVLLTIILGLDGQEVMTVPEIGQFLINIDAMYGLQVYISQVII
jgi:hypothetical protein